VAQVNHAIGAEGIISTECKEVVREYGEMILEMLVAQVFLLAGFPLLLFQNATNLDASSIFIIS
jgi:hypothetical protein